jgi:AcrR family transcriptional regulator
MTLSATDRFDDQLESLLALADEIRQGARREGNSFRPLGPKATRTRLAIITAGFEVFCEQGYRSSSVGDVHERAGVSLGTYYQYFRDKTDLVATIVAEAVIGSARSIWPSFDPSLGHDGVAAVIDGFVRHYASTADFQRVWEEVTQLEPTVADLRARLSRLLETSLGAGIAAGQADGTIDRSLEPAMAARALAAMVNRTCFLTFVLDGSPASATRDVIETLTQLWVNALQLELR